MSFSIISGIPEVGLCDFTVKVDDNSWKCQASYIGELPIKPLIMSALDLYGHFFESPYPTENAVWDSLAADEPGGILIRAIPIDQKIQLNIYEYLGEPMWPSPINRPEVDPVSISLIDYWEYAEAIINDAMKLVGEVGFLGLRDGWAPSRWDSDGPSPTFPVEEFFYLAKLVFDRDDCHGFSLEREISLLQENLIKSKDIKMQ